MTTVIKNTVWVDRQKRVVKERLSESATQLNALQASYSFQILAAEQVITLRCMEKLGKLSYMMDLNFNFIPYEGWFFVIFKVTSDESRSIGRQLKETILTAVLGTFNVQDEFDRQQVGDMVNAFLAKILETEHALRFG